MPWKVPKLGKPLFHREVLTRNSNSCKMACAVWAQVGPLEWVRGEVVTNAPASLQQPAAGGREMLCVRLEGGDTRQFYAEHTRPVNTEVDVADLTARNSEEYSL